MNEIIIIEFDKSNHYTYLESVCRILLYRKYNIRLLCHREIYNLLDEDLKGNIGITFTFFDDSKGSLYQVKKTIKESNCNGTMVWFNSIQLRAVQELFIGLSLKNRNNILTIHNAKSWMEKNFFSILRNSIGIKNKVNNIAHYFARRVILKKINTLVVLEENLKEWIIQEKFWKKKIEILPFSLFQNKNNTAQRTDGRRFRVVCPGMITEKRRDYNNVLSIFEKKQYENVELILLGRPVDESGIKVVEKCREITKKGNVIKFFDEFIPVDIYDEIMINADFVFSDFNVIYERLGSEEVYGVTKSTGVTFNMIRYAIPGILPEKYSLDKHLKSSVYTFRGEEELGKIIDVINDMSIKDYDDLKELAVRNSEYYNVLNFLEEW